MTRIPCRVVACFVVLMAFCRTPHAEPATDAQALATQIRPLVRGLLGPDSAPPDVIPDGDHYRLEIPLGPASRITAALAVSDNGQWTLSHIRLPSPSDTTPLESVIAEQSAHAVFDPAFTSPSSLTAQEAGIDVRTAGPSQAMSVHADRLGLEVAAQPGAPGRIGVSKNLVGDGVRFSLRDTNGASWEMQAEQLRVASHLDGVVRDHVGPTLAALRHLRMANGDPSAMRDMIVALRDIASSGGLAESVEGLRVGANGQQGSADRIALHIDVNVPDDVLAVRFGLAVDGAALEILPQDAASLLPAHFKLEQTLTGISMADLTQLALLSTEAQSGEQMQAAFATLFGHGPVTLALDTLSFDLGPAQVEASGKLLIASPDAAAGAVRVTATGLDALMRQVQKDPLTSLAFPVLVLARGLGRQDGERMVWDVTSEAGEVRVNGTDLGTMFALGK